MNEQSVDVAILGGGMSGNLLARQLRRQVPGASVLMVERSTEPRWKVGESTVEIASNYLSRRLGLSTYLYDQHLPKNGLRFFFDTPEKDTELTLMSELGTDRPPPTQSYQLDRARLETDLLEMNRAAGVDVRLGWTAKNIAMGEGGGAHQFTMVGRDEAGEAREERVTARWLIDGTGRAGTVSRLKDLRREVTGHDIGAVWGRFTGVVDFDSIQNDAWRRRTKYVARTLSTNHFLYDGYWMWFIPLGRGVTSVGVVGKKETFRRGMRQPEGFLSFLREHRAPASLLENAELIDLEGFTQLAYGTDRFLDGRERWALLGDAAAFPDPFYSPGSDFIAFESDYVTTLVERDLAGEAVESVADLAATYDAFLKFRFQAAMLLYRDLYSCFGSYELMKVKLNFDLGCYYNLWLDPYALDRHLDPRFLTDELRRAPDTLGALQSFSRLFQQVEGHLKANGAYHRKNLGEYSRGVDCLRHWMDEVGEPRKKRLVNQRTEEVFNYGRTEALKLLGLADVHEEPWRLYQFENPLVPETAPSSPDPAATHT